MDFNYPFRIEKGRTALASENNHIEQMIEQLLFTSPGERVNRPTFGTGLNRLVFAPLRDELVTATRVLVEGALRQWLGDLIVLISVETRSQDSTLFITVTYTVRQTQQTRVVQFCKAI